ncbi:MAG: crotonase/enoyl-CoA hydratase family protein, partial [Deltaproteobacteria bacterium]|nr:crotonase/enoyl-CoA hydratase family protein [Deltaproteobacteria bacterium]
YNFYKVEKDGFIARVILNRPEKRNAMGPDAWKEIIPIFDDLHKDDSIRAIIISAEGPMFTAGIDLVGMAAEMGPIAAGDRSAGATRKVYDIVFPLQDSITCVEKCCKPVICCIHGKCIGAGLDLASACDIRLVTQDASISLKEVAVGFVADVGSLQRVSLIVGQGIAREMAYTAKFIDARRAKEVCLVNEIYPDKESMLKAAEEMAAQIAANSPLAVQASKEVLNYCRGKSISDGLEYVAARSAMIVPSNDLMEAISAFMGKRKPIFPGN